MNKIQRITVGLVLALMGGMVLYVPVAQYNEKMPFRSCYAWIFQMECPAEHGPDYTIRWSRILAQWAVVALAGAAVFVWAGRRE